MDKVILIFILILAVGCGQVRYAPVQNPKPVGIEQYNQQMLWEQHKTEYLLFQLDPGDRVKEGVLSFDKEEDTWIYTRPNQRPLVWNNGRWQLSE